VGPRAPPIQWLSRGKVKMEKKIIKVKYFFVSGETIEVEYFQDGFDKLGEFLNTKGFRASVGIASDFGINFEYVTHFIVIDDEVKNEQ
jgi:hypothetical protein